VLRDEALPGAILTRVAASHVRVGTFQFFAIRDDHEALRLLTAHALARHYPDGVGTENDAVALLERVVGAQADLMARWLGIGFVHGVMNTDNTAVSGETIDYGPCAFLDEYDPERVFSSIDHGGRYAFSNQPRIALWNVTRLAEALLPLIATDADEAIRVATTRLERFTPRFEQAHGAVMRAKLGLSRQEENDGTLIESLLALLSAHHVDYTRFFRALCTAAASPDSGPDVRFDGDEIPLRGWLDAWRRRIALESDTPETRASSMRRANPAFIPRNHRVEEAIEAAVRQGDFQPFETLVHVLEKPYEDQPEHRRLADPPGPEQRAYKTFCGT
jgi:uncharacterized protein YdiU (UPF0061 family)